MQTHCSLATSILQDLERITQDTRLDLTSCKIIVTSKIDVEIRQETLKRYIFCIFLTFPDLFLRKHILKHSLDLPNLDHGPDLKVGQRRAQASRV